MANIVAKMALSQCVPTLQAGNVGVSPIWPPLNHHVSISPCTHALEWGIVLLTIASYVPVQLLPTAPLVSSRLPVLSQRTPITTPPVKFVQSSCSMTNCPIQTLSTSTNVVTRTPSTFKTEHGGVRLRFSIFASPCAVIPMPPVSLPVRELLQIADGL